MAGINPITGRSGPTPKPGRDGDREQARARVNVQVQRGERPFPNALPCVDCGHVWKEGDRRHEYDHHLGYDAEHHLDVVPVCGPCHVIRTNAAVTTCDRGHLFTPENTIHRGDGRRTCRECTRERERKRERPPGYWSAVHARRKARGGA